MGLDRGIRAKYATKHGLEFKTPVGQWRRSDVCDVVGCSATAPHKRRFCSKHRSQIEKNLPMKKGKGWITEAGYRRFEKNEETTLEHRLVWEQANGPIPSGMILHHKDENTLHNVLDNLELLTRSEHTKLHMKLYWARRRLPSAA